MFNYFFIKFGIAYILDLILADPRWLYHPVIIIGKLISFLEKFLYFCIIMLYCVNADVHVQHDQGSFCASECFSE